MSNVKHRIGVGNFNSGGKNDVTQATLPSKTPPFTFDSALITFDSRVRTFDETTI